jgi:hypothetical protein
LYVTSRRRLAVQVEGFFGKEFGKLSGEPAEGLARSWLAAVVLFDVCLESSDAIVINLQARRLLTLP